MKTEIYVEPSGVNHRIIRNGLEENPLKRDVECLSLSGYEEFTKNVFVLSKCDI
jgi:hypothetical protein